MMALLDALFGLWLAAGILSFIVGGVSAILRRLGASVSSRWVLPFYLIWMSPIFLAIYLFAAMWWLWEKLFPSKRTSG